MTTSPRPLILITNDDGIDSLGLLAAVAACAPLGDLLIAAPAGQQTAAGRSKPPGNGGRILARRLEVAGQAFPAWAVEASPAQVVEYALVELAPPLARPVALAVSGINYGENLGEGITVSGTVGAAMEAASFRIPALAVSLQTSPEHYLNHVAAVDFGAAAHFTRRFAAAALAQGLPDGVDLLKIDVPRQATPATPFRWTRLSRQRYFYPVPPRRRRLDEPAAMGFEARLEPSRLEPDSDIRAVALDGVVSVTPLSLDFTAPVARARLQAWQADGQLDSPA